MVLAKNPNYNREILFRETNIEWKKYKKNKNIEEIIKDFFNTPIPIQGFPILHTKCSTQAVDTSHADTVNTTNTTVPLPIQQPDELPRANAPSQKKIFDQIKDDEKKLVEFTSLYGATNDFQLRRDLYTHIENLKNDLEKKKNDLKKLKRNADYQQKSRSKKAKRLNEENEVVIYDHAGRPPVLFEHPDLLEHIHSSIEFGAADAKRRKEIIKVRSVAHLQEELENNYNEYLSMSTLRNYMLPNNRTSIAARAHHHPAMVGIANVSRSEKKEHIDSHYCLASIKASKSFASTFSNLVVMISQDDKAKVNVGIPAVGRTFQTVQSIAEPVEVEDHDFPIGVSQKLVPSVYLMINPADSNDTMRTGQLAIYVRPQWYIGTNSLTHMQDLINLVSMREYKEVFKINDTIKPLWVILVDGGPDENPRYLKNIYQYCRLFKKLDLDYLTIRTHAPGQSAFNPVERSMATLSKKLAGISLPIDTFGKHLDTQGKVVNQELGLRNFRHAGEALCTIWRRDKIFGKPVYSEYVDERPVPFSDIIFEANAGIDDSNNEKTRDEDEYRENRDIEGIAEPVPWAWIEKHTQLCKYSLDIRKCEDTECCSQKRAPEVASFFEPTNGFLPPVIQGKDNHFLNPIHTAQYLDSTKSMKYDEHCPSISVEQYTKLECNTCKKYFPTRVFLANHRRFAHSKNPKTQ